MKVKKKLSCTILFLVVVLLLSACNSSASDGAEESSGKETIKLTYAFFAPENTFPAIQMKKWSEELSIRTDGQVEVDMFFGGSLLDAPNMFEGVASGTADIGLTATTYEPGRFPLLEISNLPSGYPNAEVASKVTHDLVSEYPPKELENFKIITAFATEPSYIQSTEKISNLDELANKQLRISGGLTNLMEELGSSPVGMSQAEVPEALQTGVIEGNISSREALKDFSIAENAKYVTDYPLTLTSFVVVMNKEKWEELPEDVQKVIDDLSMEMSIFAGQYLDEHVQESLEWSIEEEGLEIVSLSASEEEKWTKIISKFQDEAVEKAEDKGLPGKEYKDRIYELLDKHND